MSSIPQLFPSKLHASIHEAAKRVHPKARGEYLDAKIRRDGLRRVTFYPQGSVVKVAAVPGWEMYQRENGAKRGAVTGFTGRAADRLMQLCNMMRRDALPVFVRLTYPGVSLASPHDAKKH